MSLASPFKVIKTFGWEMAHRLVDGYTGKCNSLHGHSWEASVTIGGYHEKLSGGYLGQVPLDKYGMLMDFGDFKILRDAIDAEWDHATMLNVSDESMLAALQAFQECKIALSIDNPTSENIARMLATKANTLMLEKFNKQQLGRLWVVRVEVAETCTSRAVYEP